tara:strand:+ start:1548 stop:1856 length:309 start_codon:yes stop_codon:yes gene_type:complete
MNFADKLDAQQNLIDALSRKIKALETLVQINYKKNKRRVGNLQNLFLSSPMTPPTPAAEPIETQEEEEIDIEIEPLLQPMQQPSVDKDKEYLRQIGYYSFFL